MPARTMGSVLAAALAAGLAACDQGVPGSGIAKIEVRPLPEFHRLAMRGSGTARVGVGQPTSLEITADDNLLPLLETRVADGRLTIEPRQAIRPQVGIVVAIRTPRLEAASLAGAGRVEAAGIAGERFDLEITGAGTASLAGETERLEIDIAGSGRVRARDLRAQVVGVRIHGSGDVHVHAARELDVSIAGSGAVRYLGNPEVRRAIAGSGSVERIE